MRDAIRVCSSDAYEPVDGLTPLTNNPRRPLTGPEQKKLDTSILTLGLFRPLLVWRGDDGTAAPSVIGGNQRFKRLSALIGKGHPLTFKADGQAAPGIPVTDYVGTEAEAKLVALRDNNSDGDWDWSALASFTANLDDALADLETGLTLGLSGFDGDFLADLSAYGANDEAQVMEAATRDPVPEQPDPTDEETKNNANEMSDKDMQVVGVVIGHVRGRLTAGTYRRLVSALAFDVEQTEGLDAAVGRLLDRAEQAAVEPEADPV